MRFFSSPNSIIALLAVMIGLLIVGRVQADEFIIEDEIKKIGDFTCSPVIYSADSSFNIEPNKPYQAGDLWRYFDQQGMNKVESLSFLMDVTGASNDIDLGAFEITIVEDNGDARTFSLGDNTAIVPVYNVRDDQPEAEMQIQLGYDFMERYKPDSTEMVTFKIDVDGEIAEAAPAFSIRGRESMLSMSNLLTLCGFVFFWAIVFGLMFKFVRPSEELAQKKTIKRPATT
ncbi:MAG: hypothetical protein AAF456_07375 [Planctomycetota bacterium]